MPGEPGQGWGLVRGSAENQLPYRQLLPRNTLSQKANSGIAPASGHVHGGDRGCVGAPEASQSPVAPSGIGAISA